MRKVLFGFGIWCLAMVGEASASDLLVRGVLPQVVQGNSLEVSSKRYGKILEVDQMVIEEGAVVSSDAQCDLMKARRLSRSGERVGREVYQYVSPEEYARQTGKTLRWGALDFNKYELGSSEVRAVDRVVQIIETPRRR
jgi:hypothetical protein